LNCKKPKNSQIPAYESDVSFTKRRISCS